MMDIDLPKMDLSRYAGRRLPGSCEQAVIFALIRSGCDIDKVKDAFSLPAEDISGIEAKWYIQITEAMSALHKSEGLDKAIDDSVAMISKDIAARKALNDRRDIMTIGESASLNKMVDRLIDIKAQSQKSYDSAIGELSRQIVKTKALERLECGEIKDDYEYLQNQKAVADMLGEDDMDGTDHKVYVYDSKDDTVQEFSGVDECSSRMLIGARKVRARIADHKRFKYRYFFSFSADRARRAADDFAREQAKVAEAMASDAAARPGARSIKNG